MEPIFQVIFRQELEGGFTAIVPSLPGCVSYGRTLSEAHRMIEDAIRCYIQSLKKHHQSIPRDEGTYVTAIRLKGAKLQKAYAQAAA